jgi:hypothetical protein
VDLRDQDVLDAPTEDDLPAGGLPGRPGPHGTPSTERRPPPGGRSTPGRKRLSGRRRERFHGQPVHSATCEDAKTVKPKIAASRRSVSP